MGDVMGDLSSRRGVIQGMEDMVGGGKNIKETKNCFVLSMQEERK